MTEEDKKETTDRIEGLKKLREKFPTHLIGKLPKPSKAQTDAVKKDYRKGIRCKICGGWHHKDVVHLDYVGHASATDRMLDADEMWTWEPLAMGEDNLPKFDSIGGLWINLTICGVTRLGYGNPDGKTGGNAIKEAIGDALRNAGMRFGIALDLWCKEDLHADTDTGVDVPTEPAEPKKKLADFTGSVDKSAASIETIEKWENQYLETMAKSDLSQGDFVKLEKYIAQLKGGFEQKEKPQFITCPNSNQKMPVEDCKASVECNATCKPYQDAIK